VTTTGPLQDIFKGDSRSLVVVVLVRHTCLDSRQAANALFSTTGYASD